MACSVRLSSAFFSHKSALKNKHLFRVLSNRLFCTKDNNSKAESSSIDDDSSKEKLKENDKASTSTKTSRFKAKPISDETKAAAKEKLMSLLSEITIVSDSPTKSAAKLNIAKAVKRISKKERLKKMEEKRMTPEKEMKMAVKAVASNFKEDSEKVESELTEKLSALNLSEVASSEDVQNAKDAKNAEDIQNAKDAPLAEDDLTSKLISSVEEVAETISENPIPPRSELTKRLMKLSLNQKLDSEPKTMRSVIEGMVIKSEQSVSSLVKEKMQMSAERRMPMRKFLAKKQIENIGLFDAPPLNIFDPNIECKPDSSNAFWQKLQEKELRLLSQFSPANAFEEMIMWTEQGKHWKFPIDNETEMGDEEKVGFHEHVFLEHHLKGFPTKGPIRHFMELVCVGLSKNPYITVERKIENIEWFRTYFKEKEEILRDAGAIE